MNLPAAVPAATAARGWVSCADDFALDAGAIDGILDLLTRGRLTATSCLVDAPLWFAAARQLPAKGSGSDADIGLHLNLTQAFAPDAAVWSLPELILRSATGLLPRATLQSAIRRQLDAFEQATGRRPDYIDGHQHVHQFSGVRQCLVAELQARYAGNLPWLRSTRPPAPVADRKARGIALLGDRPLRALARSAGIGVSDYLVGVYDFGAGSAPQRAAYVQRMKSWLQAGPHGSVFMCHPATHAPADDPIALARIMEYGYLGSEEFAAALREADIRLVTGTSLFAAATAAGA